MSLQKILRKPLEDISFSSQYGTSIKINCFSISKKLIGKMSSSSLDFSLNCFYDTSDKPDWVICMDKFLSDFKDFTCCGTPNAQHSIQITYNLVYFIPFRDSTHPMYW